MADHRHPEKRRKATNPDKCGAKTRSGGTCGLPAGHGNPDGNRSGRCSRHGGATPTGRAVAERQEQDKAAAKEATRLGIWDATLDVSPVEALVGQLQRAAGLTEALRMRLAEVDPDGNGETPAAVGLARLYSAERDRLRELAAVCAKLGIEERRLQAEEGKVRALAAAVNSAIGDVPLTAAQQSALRAALRLRLAAAEGEPPDPSARDRWQLAVQEAQAELDGLRRPVFVEQTTRVPELEPRSEPRRVSFTQQPQAAIEVHPSVQQLRELERGR